MDAKRSVGFVGEMKKIAVTGVRSLGSGLCRRSWLLCSAAARVPVLLVALARVKSFFADMGMTVVNVYLECLVPVCDPLPPYTYFRFCPCIYSRPPPPPITRGENGGAES